jgi:hypothetical protein
MKNPGQATSGRRLGLALVLAGAVQALAACGGDAEASSSGRKREAEDPQVERLRKELARLHQEISRSEQVRNQEMEAARREERTVWEREVADLKAQLAARSAADGRLSAGSEGPPSGRPDADPGGPSASSLAQKLVRDPSSPPERAEPSGRPSREASRDSKVMAAGEQEGFLRKLSEMSLAIGLAEDRLARERAVRDREEWVLEYLDDHGWGFSGWRGAHLLSRRSPQDRRLWQWTLALVSRKAGPSHPVFEQERIPEDAGFLPEVKDLRDFQPVLVSGRFVRRSGRLVHSTLNLENPELADLNPKLSVLIESVELIREDGSRPLPDPARTRPASR